MQEPLAKIIKDISLKFNDINDQKKLSHEFLFDITSVCNLNCTNCSVFCGLREPYFITVEEFSTQLKNLRDKVPVSFISFCGGEPTLHPQFMDLCRELFNQIPNCYLQIITNGTLLNKFSEKDLQFLSKYNVCFAITLYPKIEYIKIVENFENKCKTTYPNIKIDFKGIRPDFGKYDYNAQGDNDPDDFYYFCEKSHQCHSFVIFKNRLYNCCIAPDYTVINLPKDESDSFSMDNLPSYEDILKFGNHSYNSCKYCTANRTVGQPLYFWHQQNEIPSNYYGSLLDLYIYNYDEYHKLLHTFGEIPECLSNEYFLSKENKEEHTVCDPVSHFKKRFTTGKLDVFIPFDEKHNIINYKQQLFQQIDIEKCNLYFVSLNAGKDAESIVYNNFIPLNDTKISIWYLKANNIEEGLKLFSEVSFLNKKLILLNYNFLSNNNLFLDNSLQITKIELQEILNEIE